jgi:Ser/Thr protein kinase RdoA (MazF antagonist)
MRRADALEMHHYQPSADRGVIEAVLPAYRRVLGEHADCRPVDRPGFSGAFVARVETPSGAFCLRGWSAGAVGERILALHEFLAHVRSRGVDYVAVPFAAEHGETLVEVARRLWQVEPWLPGSADFWSRPSDVRLAAALGALARFHQASRGFEPVVHSRSHLGPAADGIPQTVRERIERIERWSPQRLTEVRSHLRRLPANIERRTAAAERILRVFERAAASIAGELSLAAQMPVPLSPCLRDVWHDHVLFSGDEVTGLIDPSAARTDTVAADLSRLVGSLIADDRAAWERALAAYQAVRPLSAAESVLVSVLDRSGVLLSGMAWLERPEFWQEQPPALAARFAERIERIAARADVLQSIA